MQSNRHVSHLRHVIAVGRRQFVHIDWHGTHGSRHWTRVRLHDLAIAAGTRASVRVVEFFALLHDARRRDQWVDPGHGLRSALFVLELGAEALGGSREEEELLSFACRHHSDGRVDAAISAQVC